MVKKILTVAIMILFHIFQEKPAKVKKEKTVKQVITYDIPTPVGEKKG